MQTVRAQQWLQAEGQCKAGQLLGALELDISLPGLQAATPDTAKDLLMLLLRQLADAKPPLSDSRSAATSLPFRMTCAFSGFTSP